MLNLAVRRQHSAYRNLFEDPMERRWTEREVVVLMADDDEEDYMLVKSAFEAGPVRVDLRWVEDGQQVMDYLNRVGDYDARETSPRPDLILLDIIMPVKDGLETLREIKANPRLQKIPIVLLTSSTEEVLKSSGLRLGADSFIIKPRDFREMVALMGSLHEHYFGIVKMPGKAERAVLLS